MDGTLPRGPAPTKKPFGFKNKHSKTKQKKIQPKINSSITIHDFAEGCIILGTIRSVEDDALYVDLPGGHRGILLFTEVNDYFLKQLELAVEENQTKLTTLTDFFKIGSYIMAVVLSSGTNPVELSIRPAVINTGLPIQNGSLFYAAVKSKEDNGYILDIGREDKQETCFLPLKNLNGKKRDLKIGQPIFAQIIDFKEGSKVLRFESVDTHESFPKIELQTPTFDEIRPYTVINSDVKSNVSSGALKLFVGGAFNGICTKFSWNAGLNQGDTVDARPILIDPAQKLLWMSTIPTIVDGVKPSCFQVPIGSIVETEVLRIRCGIGIECTLKNNDTDIRVFIENENSEAEATLASGDMHKVRIIERRPIDDLLFAADDKETLEMPVFCAEDAKAGQILDGTVIKVHPKFGVFVKINKFLTGLAPLAYCDDTTTLTKDTPVKAIVLSTENGQVRLALKEKLINSSYRRILSYDDLNELGHNREAYEQQEPVEQPEPIEEMDVLANPPPTTETPEMKQMKKSQFTHVIVKKVVRNGMIVEMFNGLVALIPKQYLPIESQADVSKTYQPGNVLRARVVSVDGDKINMAVTATNENVLQLGLTITVTVTGFLKDDVQVRLPHKYGKFDAIIPKSHFSDNLALSEIIANSLNVGKKLRSVLLRLPGTRAPAVLTRKRCFTENVDSIPTADSDISVGSAYFGYISGAQAYGSFVSFFGRASGLIRNQKVEIGESVHAYVNSIDKERVSLALKPEYGDSELYLRNFLTDAYRNLPLPNLSTNENEIETSLFTVIEKPEQHGDQYLYTINDEWKGISNLKKNPGETLTIAYHDFITKIAILDDFNNEPFVAENSFEATVLCVLQPIIVAKYEGRIIIAPINNYNNHSHYSSIQSGQKIQLTSVQPFEYHNVFFNIAIPVSLANSDEADKIKAEIKTIGEYEAIIELSDGRKANIHRSQLSADAKPGDIITGTLLKGKKLYMITDPLSPQHQEDFEKGMKVTGFVTRIFKDYLQLSLSPSTKGTIHALELTQSDRKLISKSLKQSFHQGDRIEGYVMGTENQFVILSTINPVNPIPIHFARVLHIKPGDHAKVRIGINDRRLLDVVDVSDEFTFNPLKKFNPGDVIDVVFVPGSDKYVSTRQSAFEGVFPPVDIEVGKVLTGYVSHHDPNYLLVRLDRGVTGKLPRNKIADTFVKNPSQLYPDGSVVQVKVESIEGEETQHSTRTIMLTSRRSDLEGSLLTIEDLKPGDIVNGYISACNQHGVFINLMDIHNKSGLVHRTNLEVSPLEYQQYINQRVRVEVEAVDLNKKRINLKNIELLQKDEDNQQQSESENEGDNYEDEIDLNEIDLDFDENQEVEEDKEVIPKKLKLTEKEIAQLEANQLEPTAPTTKEKFVQMLEQVPQSSYLWVKFIEFHFANGDIEEAKETAQRALKSLPIGNSEEKINVYISYINLMVLTTKSELFMNELKPLVREAAAATNPIRVWTHFGVFVSAQRNEFEKEAWKLALSQCKENKNYVDVWNKYLETLMNEGKSQEAREEFKRGLSSFEDSGSQDQWKFKERFGIIEFKNGNIEHGRSMFENLIMNKPLFEFWNTYIDMETKYGDVDHARELYQRVAKTDLNDKRMKSILKKWLTFETLNGDDPTKKAEIKQIAKEYALAAASKQ